MFGWNDATAATVWRLGSWCDPQVSAVWHNSSHGDWRQRQHGAQHCSQVRHTAARRRMCHSWRQRVQPAHQTFAKRAGLCLTRGLFAVADSVTSCYHTRVLYLGLPVDFNVFEVCDYITLHWYLLYANYNDNCPVAYYRLNIEHNGQHRTIA